VPTDPFASLSDDELWNGQVLLALACSRSKSIFKKNRKQMYCLGFNVYELEHANRGLTPPAAPFHVAQLRKQAL